MLKLSAKVRAEFGKKVKKLRQGGKIPGILYGPKIKNFSLWLDLKEFEKVYLEAGESSLITLAIAKGEDEALASSPSDEIGRPDGRKFLVLIHDVEFDVLSRKPIHVDFYQPNLDEEITVTIPLVFEGEARAVKDLGGTLVRNIHELEVKALPQNLPHELKVNVEKLATFEDNILVKDLVLPQGVKALKNPDEIVALVSSPQKIEEELLKPIEEKVEEVAEVKEKKEKGKQEEKIE
ncbi:MAG: 50S ribosomal protein L25 [bacterium]|nr:50S ribosomal protein L25 [bacterium]